MGESLSPTKRALLALQHMRARLDAVEAAQSQPIAIIGMACRFPGAADLQAYWRLLESGADAISEVPPNRWDVGSLGAAGRWGGFLEGLDAFDAEFFGISAREAPHVDPLQRLMLEVAWEALEDAGVPPPSLAGSATGVFVATLSNDYDSLMSRNYRLFESFTGAGTANAIVANRVSYFLDVTGPSIAIDTACSGSLVALDLACRSLRRDESSLALAGGVSVNLLPGGDVFFAAAGALSPTGRCHVFDRDADGIVRSEGAGLVVLKRLDRAIADGDRVYAVIRGSAVNHDGRSNGIMAPNGLAQEAVLREAYRQAGVSPGAVQYAEAHGTGTALGDAIEVRALAAVLADGRPAGRACMLGSVKSNLGHMEAAAGIAGVIKTALALAHRRIPATLHIANRSALLEEAGFPLYLPTRLECWPYPDEKLIAGVSSFGFGGSNAHVVLEEAPATATRPTGGRSMYLLTVSAASTEALRELQLRYREHLQANPDDVADVCYTAAVRRSHHGIRTAVAGTSADEICAQLGVQAGSMLVGGPIAFAFSGQGTQWLGMGLSLLECEPAARAVLEECDALLRERWRWSLIDLLRAPAAESRLRENSVAQAVIFAVQVAQAALWRTWGVQPDVVFGQSLGEIAAAHCAGALTLSDAIEVVYRRSLLMDTLVGRGRTAVVGLGPAQTELAIGAFAGAVTLAGHTGPNTSLVSGDTEAVARLVEDLSAREIFCRQIEDVEIAFHGPQMAPISLELERALSGLVPGAVKLRFLSTVTGGELAETRLDGGYWARNLRDPFRVGDAIRQAIAVGCRTFVEIAPHAVLGGAIRGWMEQEGVAGLVLASGRRDVPEQPVMLRSLAELYNAGRDVDWRSVYREGGRTLSLPSYPWQRERFWYDQLEAYAAPATEPPPASAASSEHKLANGTRYLERWLHPRRPSYLADHVVGGAAVVPAAYFLDLALQTSMGGVLESVTFGKPAVIGPDGLEVQLVLAPDGRYELFGRAPGEPWRHLECGSSLPPSQPTEQPQGHGRFPANHPPGDRHTLLDWGQSLAASLVAATGARSLLTAEAHYQAMQSRGLVYGPACRTVKELWRGQGRAVARVELAPDTVTEDNWIHPTLLDGCFQTVAAAAPDEGGTLYGTGVYLPRGVRRLRLAGRAPSAVWCDVTLVGEPGGARLEADLVLYGGDGNVVAEIEGLELGRLDAALPQDISQCYYGIDWVERELDGTGAAGSWLILGDGGLARELVERLEERGCACSRLDTDENLEPRLASVLASREWTGVVFLEGLRCVEGDECSVPSNPGLGVSLASPVPPFRLDFETVASMVMATVRAIAGQPSRPRLFLVTRGAQNVAGWELDEAAPQACLWGFGRTLAVEHPEFWGGLVDLDGEADATALCRELTGNDGEAQVGYRGGRRHVARLAHRVLEPRPLRIRTHGTYLITGGTHGLGLEAARWLVRHGARRLILVGRTELPPRGQWGGLAPDSREARLAEAVRELEGLGAAVHLAAVDVGVEGALPRYVEGYRAEGYPPIIGIFHAAGVLDDHLAMRMTDAALRHALAPKLNGGREIARIAAAPEVELVVLYSSATGVLGQIGQAAYGAGNAYLDALARRRDGDRVGQRWISVAWGPWAEVGMYARQSIAEGSGPSGVTPLSPEDGARALAAAIASGESELLVLRAESAGVLARAGVGSTRLLEQLTPGSVGGSAPTAVDGDFVLDLLLAAPATRRRQLEDWLTERVARVLRTSQDRVTAGRPLVSMGVDSIMAVELRNTIDKELQITVPLVDLFASTIAALVGRLDQLLATDPRLGAVLDEVEALGADE